MSFKIKNYTSQASPENSIAEVERLLLSAGATSILKEYDGPKVKAVWFKLPVDWGEMSVALPANVENVYESLLKMKKMPTLAQKQRLKEQAERTAWRLMVDWIYAQLSLIYMRQAQAAQVFLPYAHVGATPEGRPLTMFQVFREEKMKALPAKAE